MEEKNFNYDSFSDSLIISNKRENEKVKENFMFDDIIISLTGRGKIVGIEILDVSSYLENLGFNKEILLNIKMAELEVIQRRESIIITFKLVSTINQQQIEQKIPIGMIPLIS